MPVIIPTEHQYRLACISKGKEFRIMGIEIKDKDLAALVERHKKQWEHWNEGEPVEVFMADGLPCVRFESGNWWHYNVEKGTWF